jgi:hypothetical protein
MREGALCVSKFDWTFLTAAEEAIRERERNRKRERGDTKIRRQKERRIPGSAVV